MAATMMRNGKTGVRAGAKATMIPQVQVLREMCTALGQVCKPIPRMCTALGQAFQMPDADAPVQSNM
ncbi:hypothetical protein N9L68_06610 [bacterium]|nr:hypothetical protein [bacterium]